MNISRFFGSTNREALRQVRLALGQDALIVSNRRVNGGVEILAADPTSVSADGDTASNIIQPEPQSTDLAREMELMRGALEGRIDELMWGNQLKQSTNAAVLFQTLLGCGFSTALLRAMLKRLPARLSMRAAQEWVRNELSRNLPVLPAEDELWTPGLTLALVGPTGVGKTTTIAKLAARAVQRHGSEGVALLTTDTYRIGAYEQLKIYGELLRVPVSVIQNADDLVRVLGLIPSRVTVLIDNVGVSQRDRYVAEQAAMLARTDRDVKRLLVLNASSHGDTLDEVARSYSKDGGTPLQGCIITKADEASSLGAALDTAIRYRLPVHYVSNGQKVPENLVHMTPDALVERALVHEHDSKALYSLSQADLAALLSVNETSGSPGDQRARAGVDRLLGTLLSGERDVQGTFQHDAFQAACNAVEDVLPVAEAWDLWNTLADNNGMPEAQMGTLLDRLLRSIRIAGHAKPGRPVLAIHGESLLELDAGRRGLLRASLLFDADRSALVSATQQLALPQGWWASWGGMARQIPAPSQALKDQISHLHQLRPEWCVVHAFERASQTVWREAEAAGLNWMARISSVTRFVHQGSRATASAVARTLDHQAVSNAHIAAGSEGGALVPVALWAATTPVRLATRGSEGMALQLVSLKIASRDDGHIIRELLGVFSLPGIQASTAQLASWLLNVYEARAVFRCAARAIMPAQLSGDAAMLPQALLASQTALASWEVVRQSCELNRMTARLAGAPNPTLTAASSALNKLFALKKWLASAGQGT